MKEINFNDDRILVEDICKRVDELESDRDDFVIGAPDGTETPAPEQWAEENSADSDELDELVKVLGELEGYGGDHQWRGDWYPSDLINESHFTEAMKELVVDIDALPRKMPDYIVIDWEATAKNLKVDYSEIEIDGNTFYYR